MSIAANIVSGINDLVDAIIVAFNARTRPGASAFEVAVANGYTGTQAQWLLMQQGGMTTAQRTALTGADLWDGRKVTDTNTGITYRWVATPATGSARWIIWDWQSIPFTTYASLLNGATADTTGAFEANMTAGELTLNFSLAKSSLVGGTNYLQINTGFRPAVRLDFTGTALAPTSGIAALILNSDGTLNFFFSVGVTGSVTGLRSTITFRPVQ